MARKKDGWGGHGKTNFTDRQWEKAEGDKENCHIRSFKLILNMTILKNKTTT